ncbi:MAG: DUF5005 domain-containing protein [Chitinophagales bacterium]
MQTKNLSIFLISAILITIVSCDSGIPQTETDATGDIMLDAGTIITKPANKFNNLFNTFGNGWTGGDGAYSISLPDGRTLWLFGDSFLDTVYPDYSRPGTPLIRNTMVVQQGNNITTLVSGTIDSPQAKVNTMDPFNEWYWPGDGTVIGDVLYIYMLYFIRTGPGGWDFAYVRSDLVAFSLPDITEISRTPVFLDHDILWGADILEDGGYIYVYGSEEATLTKYAHVCRYPAGDITGTPEFWDGTTWTSTMPPHNVGRLVRTSGLNVDVSSQFAVIYYGGKYRLITQEGFLGPKIYSWEADAPQGPWKMRKTIYETPETGGAHFTYNAWVHPQFIQPNGAILLSYSENSNNFLDLFNDARIYRPKFIWYKYPD